VFGLVTRSRLMAAERAKVDLRVKLIEAQRRANALNLELATARAEFRADLARLTAAVEALVPPPAPIVGEARVTPAEVAGNDAPPKAHEEPDRAASVRVLDGMEVVARAMQFRAKRNSGTK
jgi:hypothetical protein